MPNRYLTVDPSSGRKKLVSATSASSGSGDGGKIIALRSDGTLDPTLLPSGLGISVRQIVASENLTALNMVNIWLNSGANNVRRADATTYGKRCIGFVLDNATSANPVNVYTDPSLISGFTGLIAGADYFLDVNNPGGITTTVPTVAGQIIQFIGVAISSTELDFNPRYAIEINS